MNQQQANYALTEAAGGMLFGQDEIVELPVLLARQEWAPLERAAYSKGVTVGQLVRDLVRAYLGNRSDPRPTGFSLDVWNACRDERFSH